MLTVHCSPAVKLAFGVIVYVSSPKNDLTVALLWFPLKVQAMLYHPLSTVTGSVKLTAMVASLGAAEAPLRGSVLNTDGPISTIGAVRRGLGAPVRKSTELLSVSVSPASLRKIAEVLLGDGAVAVSAQSARPYPTKSCISTAPIGQLPT